MDTPRARRRPRRSFWKDEEDPGIAPYLQAADLYRALRQKGRTVRSTIDCLIAILAEAHGCYVLARDRDMEAILSGLVRARAWRPGP